MRQYKFRIVSILYILLAGKYAPKIENNRTRANVAKIVIGGKTSSNGRFCCKELLNSAK